MTGGRVKSLEGLACTTAVPVIHGFFSCGQGFLGQGKRAGEAVE